MAAPDPLHELGRQYRDSLPRKRVAIVEAWQSFESATDRVGASKPLLILVHRLAGSGASYGYAEISERAICFESMLDKWLLNHGDCVLGSLEDALDELLESLAKGHAEGPGEP